MERDAGVGTADQLVRGHLGRCAEKAITSMTPEGAAAKANIWFLTGPTIAFRALVFQITG